MSLHVSLVGKPKRLYGSSAYASPSIQVQEEYEIETTQFPVPNWPDGINWQRDFNRRLSGGDLRAEHDGVNKITVYCYPDREPDWLDHVVKEVQNTNENDS